MRLPRWIRQRICRHTNLSVAGRACTEPGDPAYLYVICLDCDLLIPARLLEEDLMNFQVFGSQAPPGTASDLIKELYSHRRAP